MENKWQNAEQLHVVEELLVIRDAVQAVLAIVSDLSALAKEQWGDEDWSEEDLDEED